ncbi:hypothetical protein F2Q69_00038659 [Brassica cretica]|nr:hypothetical protein F2Q69_00038659 [Brassica cretica]
MSTTRVRNYEDLPRAVTGFQPVYYKTILDGTLNSDYLVDVIGHIVEVKHLEVVPVNGKNN